MSPGDVAVASGVRLADSGGRPRTTRAGLAPASPRRRPRRARRGDLAGALLAGCLLAPAAAGAECPAAERILDRLSALGLERGARTARFGVPAPQKLYAAAAKSPGEVETSRDGQKGVGVAAVDLPIEQLWMAINDEGNQASGDYLLVQRSEIVGGTPRGTRRRVFQAGSKMGLGRWWVTDTSMNAALFETSAGDLWEVAWEGEDQPAEAPVAEPPDLAPVKFTRGAWLLARVAGGCTLVEHFSWSDPGGFVGAMQGLVLGRALREAVEGMVRLARERYADPPEGPPFVKPDGEPLRETP